MTRQTANRARWLAAALVAILLFSCIPSVLGGQFRDNGFASGAAELSLDQGRKLEAARPDMQLRVATADYRAKPAEPGDQATPPWPDAIRYATPAQILPAPTSRAVPARQRHAAPARAPPFPGPIA